MKTYPHPTTALTGLRRAATAGATLNDSWSYDRYGNRWNQTAPLSGYQGTFSSNTANNKRLV